MSSDADLMRKLHDEHAHALWSFVVGLTGGDRAKAQDVVQETMLRAWRHPDVLSRHETARSWLYTVARRLVIDEWRTARSRHEVVSDAVPERVSLLDHAEQTVDRQVLVAALRTLRPEHREVVVECYLRGSSVAEAARRLNVPEGTVKSRAHYALRALRLALDEMGGVR